MKPHVKPLAGLKVLELARILAGPWAGQVLADLGAEVIKIEPPGQPDPMRVWGHVRPEGRSLWFAIIGRNKKCITLDLRKPEGQQALKDLVAKSDILVENFRPGVMEKWGLGFDALSAINPGLIMVRVSGYGQTGPYAPKAGYASVGEAMGGLRYVMGEADRKPSRAGISLGDSLAAMFGAMGALSALHHRAQTGRGQMVDSAIYESVLAMMECLIPDYQFGGRIRERTGAILPKLAPSNIYTCSDGMVIIAANQDGVFARLCDAMGEAELAADPRYATHIARGEAQGELDERIDAWSSARTMAEVEALCETHGVPCGRVNRAPELLADPHVAAREAIVEAHDRVLGAIRMQGAFPKFSETPGNVRWAAPDPGAHNDDVFRDLLGYSDDRLAALRSAGIV